MWQYVRYYQQAQGVGGNLRSLPGWAKGLVFVAALPGVALLALSIAVGLVSLFVLFVLTTPVYRLARWMSGGGRRGEVGAEVPGGPGQVVVESSGTTVHTGRRQVDVRIVE